MEMSQHLFLKPSENLLNYYQESRNVVQTLIWVAEILFRFFFRLKSFFAV